MQLLDDDGNPLEETKGVLIKDPVWYVDLCASGTHIAVWWKLNLVAIGLNRVTQDLLAQCGVADMWLRWKSLPII